MRIDPGCQRELNSLHTKSRGFARGHEGGRHLAYLEKLHLYELKMHAAIARLELRSQGQIPPKSFLSREKTPEQHNARLRGLIAQMKVEGQWVFRITTPAGSVTSTYRAPIGTPPIYESSTIGQCTTERIPPQRTLLDKEKDRLKYSVDIAGQFHPEVTLDEEQLNICANVQKLARKTIRNLYHLPEPVAVAVPIQKI